MASHSQTFSLTAVPATEVVLRQLPVQEPAAWPERQITLMREHRLSDVWLAPDEIAVVRSGLIAIDLRLKPVQRQILQFMVAGDLLPAGTLLAVPSLSLRAVSHATLGLVRSNRGGGHIFDGLALAAHRNWARLEILRGLLGRLESEERFVSFLVACAARAGAGGAEGLRGAEPLCLELPISRTEIGDHLGINPDTLSRIMGRLERDGVYARPDRGHVVIADPAALMDLSRISRAIVQLVQRDPVPGP